jgi:hypothetical protein
VLLDRERVHDAELLELRAQVVELRAQRRRLDVDRLERRQQIVERTPPLGLEPLAQRVAPTRELRVSQ